MQIENITAKNINSDVFLSLLSQEQAMLNFDVLKYNLKNEILGDPHTLNQAEKILLRTKDRIEQTGNPIQDAKDYFSHHLVLCMILNNFNAQYNTNNLVQDKEVFRKLLEAYVLLKPTDSEWLEAKLAPWRTTTKEFEIFFDKVTVYFQGYMNTSIDGKPSLTDTYSSALNLYKADPTLFDPKTFAKIISDISNIYVFKNASKSGYKNALVAYDLEKSDQDLIESLLDICELQKNDIFAKLEEYIQYKSGSETFLKKQKFRKRKKKEEEMKTFGRKSFPIYTSILKNYDLVRKIHLSMDASFVETSTYQQETQKIENFLKDIASILAKQKK